MPAASPRSPGARRPESREQERGKVRVGGRRCESELEAEGRRKRARSCQEQTKVKEWGKVLKDREQEKHEVCIVTDECKPGTWLGERRLDRKEGSHGKSPPLLILLLLGKY